MQASPAADLGGKPDTRTDKDTRPHAPSAGACRSCPTTARSRSRSVRADDNKDRWLVAVDPESGKARVLDALHDDAWVREVGGFGPDDPSFGWLPDQKHLWFLSERDGWMHLYTVDATADAARPRAS